jgi:hypothetical protein
MKFSDDVNEDIFTWMKFSDEVSVLIASVHLAINSALSQKNLSPVTRLSFLKKIEILKYLWKKCHFRN